MGVLGGVQNLRTIERPDSYMTAMEQEVEFSQMVFWKEVLLMESEMRIWPRNRLSLATESEVRKSAMEWPNCCGS